MGGNPTFNQMPEDPNQEPDFIKSPFNNKANPYAQTRLIKDLLKYTPEQLDNKEAELVNMIDNAINSNKNVIIFYKSSFPAAAYFIKYFLIFISVLLMPT